MLVFYNCFLIMSIQRQNEIAHNKAIKKYGQGIIFDWTGADLESREIGKIEEYLFTVPANTINEQPVAISIAPKEQNAGVKVMMEVGAKAQVCFVQNIQLKEYCELEVNVHVAEGAQVEYVIVQNVYENGFLKSTYRGQVDKGGSLTWFDVEMGGKIISADIQTNLVGENATGRTFGIFMGSAAQAFDIRHRTNHLAGQTASLMESKGVLDGMAKAIYRGLIHIPTGIVKCNGFERSDVLLLSKQAQVSNIPELEIGNNDVQCGHASTISRIDKEKLFYFGSRGISSEEAVRECALGHVGAVADKIQNPQAGRIIKDLVLQKYD